MKKFDYKYKTIQNIKEIQESKIQKEISDIDIIITQLKAELTELEIKKKKFLGDNNKAKCKASEMKFRFEYISFMEDKKKKVLAKINEMHVKKKNKHNELVQKSKEKKIFNKMEEKCYEEFLYESNKEENLTLDEIAIQRYSRKK